ncbi:MAG TPA: hypothetical protein VI306_00520 [Pyrinomonadaceae bacterium]
MKFLKKNSYRLPLVALSLLVLGSAVAFAQQRFMLRNAGRPVLKVTLSGSVEREGQRLPVDQAGTVKSGEILDWSIVSENEGTAAAHEYSTTGIIPAGTQFVAGSATADGSTTVSYSIDNGKSFTNQPMVDQRQADGSNKKVAAPVSMYTHVRYTWADPIAQGAKVNAAYKVRLR